MKAILRTSVDSIDSMMVVRVHREPSWLVETNEWHAASMIRVDTGTPLGNANCAQQCGEHANIQDYTCNVKRMLFEYKEMSGNNAR
jgi:hypothetical protein